MRNRVHGGERQSVYIVDGVHRPVEAEHKLNLAFATTFSTQAGQLVLDYLRMITLNTVMDATATDAQLRMQEGMRTLYSIIHRRVEDGRERKPDPPAEPAAFAG